MKQTPYVIGLLWLTAVGTCYSGGARAQEASLVFEVPADAGMAALGGQYAASLGGADLGAALVLPTMLDSSVVGEGVLAYVDYFAGMKIGGANYAVRTRGRRTWQVGTRFWSYGEIVETDPSGAIIGGFSGGDYLLQSGVTWQLDSTWTAGITGWGGYRYLEREAAVLGGVDVAVMGRWPDKQLALGLAVTSFGGQIATSGSLPSGGLPASVQLGLAKGFSHAPFVLYATAADLQTWNLAPPGTYDDTVDQLTGDTIANGKFALGDQLMRHMKLGVSIELGPAFSLLVGFDYRRRQELRNGDQPGTNGIGIGMDIGVKRMRIRLARNAYHAAGASTHLSITTRLF